MPPPPPLPSLSPLPSLASSCPAPPSLASIGPADGSLRAPSATPPSALTTPQRPPAWPPCPSPCPPPHPPRLLRLTRPRLTNVPAPTPRRSLSLPTTSVTRRL